MRFFIFTIAIIFIGCDNLREDKYSENKMVIDSLKRKDTILFDQEFKYDRSYLLKQLGSEKFNFLRNNYKQDLYSILNSFGNTKVQTMKPGFNETIKLIENCGISPEQLRNLIPISPTEFKIYDSCFSDKKYKNKIECFEKVVYELACNSSNDFILKEDFIIQYVNMYSYIYQGILLNEERLGDDYYFYEINSIICKNRELFCQNIWFNTNELVKLKNNDLYNLYNCRCEKKVINEFDFCE
ncbi:MAG: hypothetical protein MUF43_13870 [Flavobacterium sp.]|jgi:hypothetical protein|nr:hypothetical protein [Flavobacterium sp.]